MLPQKIKKISITTETTLKEAIVKLNETAKQILLVLDESGRLLGTVTDGDIRRVLLKKVDFRTKAREFMFTEPAFLGEGEIDTLEKCFIDKMVRAIPIVDEQEKVVDIRYISDALQQSTHRKTYKRKFNKVFILAGGKGSRLKPVTNILPKPLLPVGEVPIVKLIMNRFQFYGFSEFILSLNYKAEMIKLYFAGDKDFGIEYVEEREFSGTAGSLNLLKGKLSDTLLVSNCDILLDFDIQDFLEHHKKQKNDATIVGVIKHVHVPYGVLETLGGRLTRITEKPEYDFIVNAGIYAIEPSIIEQVPANGVTDMPDLLQSLNEKGFRVGVYPVSSKMIDVGHWEEYKEATSLYDQFSLFDVQK